MILMSCSLKTMVGSIVSILTVTVSSGVFKGKKLILSVLFCDLSLTVIVGIKIATLSSGETPRFETVMVCLPLPFFK